jgi:urease accessory protein
MKAAPLPVAAARMPIAGDPLPFDLLLLSWRERLSPNGEFECVHGDRILLDLPPGMTVGHGTRLFLIDGRNVEVIAAEEYLAEISGPGLEQWAGFLARRGIPCQREPNRLLIRRDTTLEDELHRLGAALRHVSEPFEPETSGGG